MASGMYSFGVSQLMRGNIDLVNDTIAVVAVSSAYTPALSSHQYQNDIPDAAQIGEVDIEGNAIVGTAFFANSATIEEPTSGLENNAVVIIKNTGDSATSQLIAYLEVVPVTTDGTPLTVDWDVDGIIEL